MDYILDNISIGDWLQLGDNIQRRKKREALLSLSIAHNPYSKDPNSLYKELSDERVNGLDSKMDKKGLDELRKRLRKSKMIKVKE
jgi:hypothetical protein